MIYFSKPKLFVNSEIGRTIRKKDGLEFSNLNARKVIKVRFRKWRLCKGGRVDGATCRGGR